MMLFHCKPTMRRLLLAFLLLLACSLTGQSQPKNESLNPLPPNGTSSSSNLTNESTKAVRPTNTTSELWFHLSIEQIKKVNTVVMSVATLGVLLNFLVIVAMAIDPLKILRKGPWVTILNLAIADLISCISFFCIWGELFFFRDKWSELYTTIVDFSWMFGVSASFLFLTFLTVQIFLITKFPLTRRNCFTSLEIVLICIALWLLACPMGLSNIAYLRFPHETSFKLYAAQIGILQLAVLVQIFLNIQVIAEIIRSGRTTGSTENTKHRNIAKTVVVLTLILFITAFPYFVLKQIEYLVRLGYFGKSNTATILFGIAYCFTPIAGLNFTANPILYSLRLPQYRKTLLALVGKRESGSRKRSLQNTSSKLTNAFSLQSQRASTMMTSPQRSSLERSSMLQNTEQPM